MGNLNNKHRYIVQVVEYLFFDDVELDDDDSDEYTSMMLIIMI